MHTITYYEVFGIGDPKNATLIIHFNYKNNSKENYILFDIADITDLLMIIVKTQILFKCTVIDITNLFTPNPIFIWVFSKLVETPRKSWY